MHLFIMHRPIWITKIQVWWKALNNLVAHQQLILDVTRDRKYKVDTILDTANTALSKSILAVGYSKEARQYIKDATEVSADMHIRGGSQVIVTGRYRNADYVNIFSIEDGELGHIINLLRDMQQHATVRRLDAPFGMREVIAKNIKF